MLNPKHLRVLVEIAERGTFSAAADELCYTPGAVSQQVAALERQIGTSVFVRGTRPLQLTEAGRTLLVHARRIFHEMREAQRELEAIDKSHTGRLSLATFATATAALGAGAVTDFQQRYPDVDIRLIDATPTEGLRAVSAGGLEMALVFDYDCAPLTVPEELERLDLLHERMLVALPARHRLAYSRTLELSDLATDRWIAGRADLCRAALAHTAAAAGFEARVCFETDDYTMAQTLVAAGIGIALIPDLATANLLDGVVLRPLSRGLPTRRVALIWRRSAESAACRAMLEVLRGYQRPTVAAA